MDLNQGVHRLRKNVAVKISSKIKEDFLEEVSFSQDFVWQMVILKFISMIRQVDFLLK